MDFEVRIFIYHKEILSKRSVCICKYAFVYVSMLKNKSNLGKKVKCDRYFEIQIQRERETETEREGERGRGRNTESRN